MLVDHCFKTVCVSTLFVSIRHVCWPLLQDGVCLPCLCLSDMLVDHRFKTVCVYPVCVCQTCWLTIASRRCVSTLFVSVRHVCWLPLQDGMRLPCLCLLDMLVDYRFKTVCVYPVCVCQTCWLTTASRRCVCLPCLCLLDMFVDHCFKTVCVYPVCVCQTCWLTIASRRCVSTLFVSVRHVGWPSLQDGVCLPCLCLSDMLVDHRFKTVCVYPGCVCQTCWLTTASRWCASTLFVSVRHVGWPSLQDGVCLSCLCLLDMLVDHRFKTVCVYPGCVCQTCWLTTASRWCASTLFVSVRHVGWPSLQDGVCLSCLCLLDMLVDHRFKTVCVYPVCVCQTCWLTTASRRCASTLCVSTLFVSVRHVGWPSLQDGVCLPCLCLSDMLVDHRFKTVCVYPVELVDLESELMRTHLDSCLEFGTKFYSVTLEDGSKRLQGWDVVSFSTCAERPRDVGTYFCSKNNDQFQTLVLLEKKIIKQCFNLRR